ncbi:class I SAM-dependent methyltransferase [Verrucomicrobium sp. 3C]|uniref:class I SAM-dependent methyltransferase n=1 Tax=Verrucomicrobium sp. 3C TaxID=1134055 RepID=UPI000380FD80|nr:methyltransferase domain-containing protein [Verrucomicrobium sp. 3C]
MRAQSPVAPKDGFGWRHALPAFALSFSLLLLAAPSGFSGPAAFDSSRLAKLYERMSAPQYEIGTKLVALLEISPGSSVLDLGCGTGQLASAIARVAGPRGKVLGMDPSPYRIAIAERRARKGLSFVVGGSEDLPRLAPRSFDVVCLNYVFHWIDDRRQALGAIHRILKPGGKLGISFEDTSRPTELDKIIEQSAKEVLGTLPPGLFLETAPLGLTPLKEMLRKSGFRVVVVKKRESEDQAKSPEELLAFWRASSAGRFLSGVSERARRRVLHRIEQRLAEAETGQGIRITSETLLLIAVRSDED